MNNYKKIFKLTFIASVAIAFGISSYAQADSWPAFRGPENNGQSKAIEVPAKWDSNNNISWKTDIDGKGWSSPVILDGKIWLTTADPDGKEFRAICIDENSGKIVFNIKVFEEKKPLEIHPLNSYASPSPVLEKGFAYVHFGTYGTACINSNDGRIEWKRRDINCDHEVGPGSSPVLYKNILILTMDGTDFQYIQALNKKNGKTVWKKHRGLDFSEMNFDRKKAFFTPIISEIEGQPLLLSPGPHAIMGYNPNTGEEKWIVNYEGFSGSTLPLLYEGDIFLNTGFGQSSVLSIKLGGNGNQTDNAINWLNKKSTQARSSPLIIDGLLYMINTGGQAICLDPKTGKEIWRERIGGQTSASPVYVEGRIYTFDEDGLCTIFKPGRTFEKITENHLPEGVMASPAVVDGALFIRTKASLYKIAY